MACRIASSSPSWASNAACNTLREKTDEIYDVIEGSGSMVLDDEEIELHEGVVVYVPRGVKHKAIGRLTVLTVCIPRGVLLDVHELE